MKTFKYVMMMTLALVTFTAGAQLKVGDKAPGFKLKNIDHQWVSLDDYKDQKGVIVVFSCNHCPYVVLYESRMIELQKKYEPKKFPLIAINPNDSTIVPADGFSYMITNAAEKGFNFPYLLDDKQLFKKFGATRTPHVYLLKNEGDHFTVAYIGAIDDNPQDASDVKEKYVAQAIDALLAGQKPKVTETRAIGCTIKFRE
ncbi:thioredoxin family protein [Alkalitalea saponilacus]|uniref:Peroxiredoxin n=1 Tax=Alkalitalea saponilacus TaxID=889453 RepID=A0A1T5DB75_9BACT|nr:thioredoxin family protein [Alkalitalea saponilacus]ASB50645.1 thioredoxin family protein [Alkalitalea saponilacus]SKB68837.1 Peroxiredoxin [Alkalitalea saponilacus]